MSTRGTEPGLKTGESEPAEPFLSAAILLQMTADRTAFYNSIACFTGIYEIMQRITRISGVNPFSTASWRAKIVVGVKG